jgi:DNA invertase Pin-like site-specific DNA recombinase
MSSQKRKKCYNKQKVNIRKNKKKVHFDIDNLDNLLQNMKTTDTSKDAIIYIRCSTKKQNEDNLHGYATQLGLCKEYADKNNFNIIEILYDTIPGHNISKMKINNILEDSIYYNMNIIVADPSRLSRSPSGGTCFVMECLNKKIICHSARHNISTNNNPELKLFLSYILDAYTESQIFISRMKSMMYLKKKHGSYIGVPPYGYHLVKDKYFNTLSEYPISVKKLDKHEQDVIKLIAMLTFGAFLEPLYTLLRKLSNDFNAKLYYYDKNHEIEFKNKICYGYLREPDIADILNDFNIFKRGKLWTKYSVSRIIKNLKNDNYDEYLYEDNDGVFHKINTLSEIISSKENSDIMVEDIEIEDKIEEQIEDKIYKNPSSFFNQLSSNIMNFIQNGHSKI